MGQKFLYVCFVLSVLFPYIKVIPINIDTQPTSLLLSFIIILLYSHWKINKELLYTLFVVLLIIPILMFYSGINMLTIRSALGYLSVLTISWATVIVLKLIDIKRLLNFSILIWFFVGFVQFIYDRSFLTFLLSSSRTSLERGVTSLAVEPSYYGIICLFFLLYNHLFLHKKYIFLLLLIQIVLFCQSTMIIAYLGVFFIAYFISHNSFKINFLCFVIIVVLLCIGKIYIESYEGELRIFKLLKIAFANPLLVAKLDASANDRIGHIYYSLKGFLDNFTFPHGFGEWKTYLDGQLSTSKFFFWLSKKRIMSTYGSALFELGILGLFLPIIVVRGIFKLNSSKDKIFMFIFINIFFLTAIPVAFPFVGFFIGTLISPKMFCINKSSDLSLEH